MPGGWGRRATGKIDRKLEDDALFKEIGGQLGSTNFDYTQWQRTGKSSKLSISRRPTQLQIGSDTLRPVKAPAVKPVFTVSAGPGSTFHKVKSLDAPVCKHGRHKRDIKQEILHDAAKEEQLKILRLRINARKKTLEEYKQREQQLLDENIKLQEEIENQEEASHEAVKKLLRKYEKFRGGLTTLNDKFMKDLSAVENDLKRTEKQIETDLGVLQTHVDEADAKLKDKQTELNILMSYKDKEYPVKALKISDLQKEIKQLDTYQQEEQSELKRIVDTEIDKLRREQLRTRNSVTQKATESSLSQMHPSLKEMALQNMVMQKELEFHKAEVAALEVSNKKLEEDVKKLLRDPKTSIRQQMFPEFYPQRPKCTPEMEVILDIPTQEWLPI